MNQFCDKCGLQINQTTGSCPNCAPNHAVNNQPQMNKPENKKHTTKEVVAVVVAIALFSGLFGILGYVFGKVQNSLPKSYNEIIEKYKLVMVGEKDEEKTLNNKLIDKVNELDNYEICYSYADINNDKTKELIIGGHVADEDVETYDIYTMDSDKNAVQIIPVNDYDEDTEIEIYNKVIKVSEEKEETSHFEYLKLPENQWKVVKDEEYLYEDEKYFEVIEEEKIEISEETFEKADTKYEGEEFDLEWVKITMEEDRKEKETEVTTLTDAQIASFEDMLNDMTLSWERYSDELEEVSIFGEIDDMIYTFILIPGLATTDYTMYYHYFGEDYKEKEVSNKEGLAKVVFEYDADKILFILNDVFGYNVTQSHNSEYTYVESYKIKSYFNNNRFYIELEAPGGGCLLDVSYKVDSYEFVGDGYFKIKTRLINGETDYTGEDCYYIVKPAQHSKFGEYWKFKEYGKGNEVYWSNSGSNATKPTETTTKETTTEKPKLSDTEIYQEYLKNGGMNKFLGDHGNKNYFDIESCLIDINNDGTSELLLKLIDKEYTGMYGYQMHFALFGLQKDKVVTLKEAYFGGGTGGGDYLFIKYDSQKKKHVIVKDGFENDGSYGGSSYIEAYSYNGSTLTKYLDLYSPRYDASHYYYTDTVKEYNAQTSFYTIDGRFYTYYKIDGQFVSETDYNKAEARFKDPTDSRYKMKKGTWSNPLAL